MTTARDVLAIIGRLAKQICEVLRLRGQSKAAKVALLDHNKALSFRLENGVNDVSRWDDIEFLDVLCVSGFFSFGGCEVSRVIYFCFRRSESSSILTKGFVGS